MESGKYLRSIIAGLKGKKFNTYRDLAQMAHVNQGNLSSFMKPDGDPKRRETMTFDSAWKIFQALGLELPTLEQESPTIKRMGANAPVEVVAGSELLPIPVFLEAGAGLPVELWNTTPERTIPILPQYYRKDVRAVEVTGDSMEPTIKKGAIVGVIPLDGDLVEGGIYLIRRPPFGLVVKRVRASENGGIVLVSDNPEYGSQRLDFEGYSDIIIGQVIWCWQEY